MDKSEARRPILAADDSLHPVETAHVLTYINVTEKGEDRFRTIGYSTKEVMKRGSLMETMVVDCPLTPLIKCL